MKAIELTLPEFAFLDGNCHLGDTLQGRDVIFHIRSGSVVEIFPHENVLLKDNVLRFYFEYNNMKFNVKEKFTCALHYCLQSQLSTNQIIENVLIPAVEFYKKYLAWEDDNIINDEIIKRITNEN